MKVTPRVIPLRTYACAAFLTLFSLLVAGCGSDLAVEAWKEQGSEAGSGAAKLEPPDGAVYTGVAVNRPGDWSIGGAIEEWENWSELVGGRTAISHEFTTLDNWPQWAYDIAEARGATPMLSLEAQGGYETEFTTTDVARGEQDEYILRHAHLAREHSSPIFLRLGHEMNGEWYSYSAYNEDGSPRANTTEDYKQMWRRVSIIFDGGSVRQINSNLQKHELAPLNSEADVPEWMDYPRLDRPDAKIPPADNVAFVWSPNALSIPDVEGNQPLDYYPGDQFVDWVAQDVYHAPWSTSDWRFFRNMDKFYQEFSVERGKPYMLAEFGLESHPRGWDSDDAHADFVSRVLNWYEERPKAKALVYYSWDIVDQGKTFKTLDNDPESAETIAEAWRQQRYLGEVRER